MKYTALLPVIALIHASLAGPTEPGPVPESLEGRMAVAAPIEGFLDSVFEKRACTATKCVCNKIQGQFCGNTAINPACRNDHVYECNASTGKACDYGYRSSCAKCGKLSC